MAWKNTRKGRCKLCGSFGLVERHHVLYRPERTLDLCHSCHFNTHYKPWLLNENQIKTLLIAKLYGHEFEAFIQNISGQKEKINAYAHTLSLLAGRRQPLPDIAPSAKSEGFVHARDQAKT
ncbi:MAG: hypothetical protein WC475_01680 [Candidatus Paceibacterota bacterium]|jgi:hypothetical protein